MLSPSVFTFFPTNICTQLQHHSSTSVTNDADNHLPHRLWSSSTAFQPHHHSMLSFKRQAPLCSEFDHRVCFLFSFHLLTVIIGTLHAHSHQCTPVPAHCTAQLPTTIPTPPQLWAAVLPTTTTSPPQLSQEWRWCPCPPSTSTTTLTAVMPTATTPTTSPSQLLLQPAYTIQHSRLPTLSQCDPTLAACRFSFFFFVN